MVDPNRISPVGPAVPSVGTDSGLRRRLSPVYVPGSKTPPLIGIMVGTLGAVCPVLAAAPIPAPWGVVAAAVCGALAAGLAGYFGMKSAGVREQE